MILQREHRVLRQNFIFYLVGVLVVLGAKYYYSQADCDSLLWILAPTTHWVELLSGIPFTYISGTGYVNHRLRLLIAPACSGVRFMIITFATLVFSFVHSIASLQGFPASKASLRIVKGLGWIAVSIFFSWIFTVFVNGLRIITAIYLPQYLDRAGLMGGLLTPDRLHTMIGVVVYFIALLTIYRLVGYLVSMLPGLSGQSRKTDLAGQSQAVPDSHKAAHSSHKATPSSQEVVRQQCPRTFARKCMSPVFWYFFMTLGLPFLNRAYLKSPAEFTELATLVICCAALILLPYYLLSLLRSRKL